MIASLPRRAVRSLDFALLWSAGLLVPVSKRSEWLREWHAELWYVLRKCSLEAAVHPGSTWQATAFCLGAYRDAICLRQRSRHNQQPLAQLRASPSACILLLIGTLLSAWGIAHISTRVAAVSEMSRLRVYPSRPAAPQDCSSPETAGDPARSSSGKAQGCFDGFARYRIAQEIVTADGMPRTEWAVAQASPDFFSVLHLPVHFSGRVRKSSTGLPQIVLSEDIWFRDFSADPKIAGTHLRLGSVDGVVAGVASSGSGNLPGSANAWLLESRSQFRSDSAEFVVGHLTPKGYFALGPRWVLSLFGVALALLLSVIARSRVGEYCRGSRKPSLARRARFWAFLMAKIFLELASVYFVSVVLDAALLRPSSHFSGSIQFGTAFVLSLLALRWAFRDQQQRCPVCLRRMTHPVEVGEPSRTFLTWSGTEMVCERGHSLLHVPGTPTSWFGARRWICLDESWEFLFAGHREMPTS